MEATVPCPPINTARLKPIRQQLNRSSMSITDSGHVIMELKSHMTGQDERPFEITKELISISQNGLQIEVFHNPEGVKVIDECHVICQSNQVYTYPNLPDKMWKKYQLAYKFVEVIKSRTAKVTLITNRARCKLMENLPQADFQACFCDGVTLVLSKLKVAITDQNGSSLTFHEDLASSHVSPQTATLVEYSQQCRNLCLKIEQKVSNLSSGEPIQDFFPITVGSSSQPCLMLDHPPSPDQVTNMAPYNSADVWATSFNRTSILLHLHDVHTNAKTINQSAGSEQSYDFKQAVNELPSKISEQQIQHNSNLQRNSYICTASNLLQQPFQPARYETTFQDPDLCTSLPSDSEAYKMFPEECNQLEDSDVFRRKCLNRNCQSALTTPQKSNMARFSSQPFHSKSMKHLGPQISDVIDKNVPTQTAFCEDKKQFTKPDKYTIIHYNNLVHKFQSECSIPQHLNDFGSSSAHSYNKCELPEEQAHPPLCHTISCENIFYQDNLAKCNPNIPDLTASEFQNNLSTPKKQSIPLNSNPNFGDWHSIKHKHSNEREKYNLTRVAETDQRCLQNVQRNLFADNASKLETFSSLSTSQTNILQSELLELAYESSSENSASLNILEDGISDKSPNYRIQDQDLVSENLVSENRDLAKKNQCLVLENQMAGLQPQMIHSYPDNACMQPSVPEDNYLAAAEIQRTPLKAPCITKSVFRYSSLPGTPINRQTKALNLNASLDHTNTHDCNPSQQHHDDQQYFECCEVNKPNSKKNSSEFDVQATQHQMIHSTPDFSSSPTKSAPIRKIASLSPLKMSSRLISENRFNKTLDSDLAESSNLLSWGNQTLPILQSQNISNSGLSLTNSSASNHATHSKELQTNTKSDPRVQPPSNHFGKLNKEFPAISQRASNWSDLPLPFLPHVRNSLDVSSDGCSSPPSSASDVICQVFVPYTGWASFYATGTVWILYNDGTQLGVKSTEAIMIYIDQDGSQTRYSNADVVPEIVKLKLEKLPKVIDMLMKSQATNFAGTVL